jgi:hypothetical protein
MKHGHILLGIVVPLALAACDEKDDEIAIYRATLTQINEQFSAATPSGTAEIEIRDDDLITVRIGGIGLDDVTHPQTLRHGDECPDESHDVNEDGVVDIQEGRAAYGAILLPLDGDLTTQFIEAGSFPFGESYSYDVDADFEDFEDAIEGPDSNPNDFLVSLAPGESLSLGDRTIVIHGVELPVVNPLIAGEDGLGTVAQTVPILCGRLERVE